MPCKDCHLHFNPPSDQLSPRTPPAIFDLDDHALMPRPQPLQTSSAHSASFHTPADRDSLHITQFARPLLFSYSYELLFPQLLCFDNHLSCPRVSPLLQFCPRCSVSLCDLRASVANLLFSCCCTLLFSLCALFSRSFSLFSIVCSLFLQKHPGWGAPLIS